MTSYEKYEEIRKQKGLKNADVARLAQIPPSTFTDWKQGKSMPKAPKLSRIANVLGCYFEDIYCGDEDEEMRQSLEEFRSKLKEETEKVINNLPTKEEMLLISYFAQLTPEKQESVLNLIKTML